MNLPVPVVEGEVIVQVACGFARCPKSSADTGALSVVDHDRSAWVRERYHPGNQIYVTGMVPYDHTSTYATLATLNAAALILGGVPEHTITPIKGLNAFSESWEVCRTARAHGFAKIIVVSSDFHLVTYARLWRAAARRNGLMVEIVSLAHAHIAAPRVRNFYSSIRARSLTCVAVSSAVGHFLAMLFADYITASRKTSGFSVDGYTKLF